jgi:hypothetical protein
LKHSDWIRGVISEGRNRNAFGQGLVAGFDPFERAVQDTYPLKAYWTTRRAGKTTAALVGDIVLDQFNHPDSLYAYIALTLNGAEGITRKMMESRNRDWGLGARFHESKYRWMFPNGAQVRLYGADKPGWINKLLGHEFRKVVIDEAAFYSVDIQDIIDDLEPTVLKGGGQIVLASNPGHFPKGVFYDITTEGLKGAVPGCGHWMSEGKRGRWSVHRWSALDNPYMSSWFAAKLADLKETRPDVETTANFRRLYLGEWTTDPGNRVYGSYDLELNRYPGEFHKKQSGDVYILGVDLGWFDNSAFCVTCWNPDRPEIIVLETHREPKMDPVDVAKRIRMYMGYYPGLRIVGDPDHRQGFEQLRIRYGLPIREAEKTDKADWIALVNQDLMENKIQLVRPEASPLSQELTDLTWLERPNGKVIENPAQSNDACDGFLYAYKEAYHYRYVEKPKPLVPGTVEFFRAESDRLEKEMLKRHEERTRRDETDWY